MVTPKPGIQKTTLGELGLKLPLGLKQGGIFHRDFTIRPWRMPEEKALSRARSEGGQLGLGKHVGTVVAYMCPLLGHHAHDPKDASDKALAERRVFLSQMYMGDVWYVYASIRRAALGDDLNMKLKCPRCREDFPWAGSLSSLGVRVPDSLEAAGWDYPLINPVEIRGKLVTKFRMGPQTWNVMERLKSGSNVDGDAKEITIRASVHGLNDDPDQVSLSSSDLDQLTKRDIEGIASQIDKNYIGPNMAIELGADSPCPNAACGFDAERVIPIDWSFDNFFGISSP